MFLPQPSQVLSIFTGLNYSLPVHTTVVVMKGGRGVDFSFAVLDHTSQWMLDILKIDRHTGDIELKAGWKKMIWKNLDKAKREGKLLENCLSAKA
jgi:hypothetical protein